VTGFIMYLLRVPICWKSKEQKGVTLSRSEAEYVELFLRQLRKFALFTICWRALG
jgi:hypothetical protein